jgi:hypothetical protein
LPKRVLEPHSASMLSADVIRKLLDDPSLTDQQIEDIRVTCHTLAELAFEAWRNGQLEPDSSSEVAVDSTPGSRGL